MRTSITYLGGVIDEQGIRPDPETLKTIQDWKEPRNEKEMQCFLGFTNYYRGCGHSDIAHPMQLMINKGNDFNWTEEAREAFENTKIILSSSPVLALPVDDGHYLVDTDAF